ncbi:DUF3024 domain-containing protein, partial [Mycobacterium sp.]|uniref:DUF3024 domain-containing protein n=1 Tax=Mycobacterium sp. TaxID=1785 RepID=UPI003C751CBD
QLGIARVQRWSANQVPEHIRSIECDTAPRYLTICECRPPWREDVRPDWTARTADLWSLYWRDQNLKYHRYQPLDPAPESKTYSTTSIAEPIPFSGG